MPQACSDAPRIAQGFWIHFEVSYKNKEKDGEGFFDEGASLYLHEQVNGSLADHLASTLYTCGEVEEIRICEVELGYGIYFPHDDTFDYHGTLQEAEHQLALEEIVKNGEKL